MSARRLLSLLPTACLAATAVRILAAWSALPERVPTHFNFAGQPDGWGPKAMIWALPAMSLVMEGLMAFVGAHPELGNYPVKVTDDNRAGLHALYRQLMLFVRLAVAVMLNLIAWLSVDVALGQRAGLPQPVMVTTLVVLVGGTVVFIVRMAQER